MINKIKETADFLIQQGFIAPEIGIVLGTGLGKLMNEIEIICEVEYGNIPHFPVATVEFHKGKLIYGNFGGKKVVVMQGRFHLYEGYNLQEITYPIRVLEKLGIKTLLMSNAAGAVNLNFKKGELMLIDDHINLQGGSPLAFKGVEQLGERFVDMYQPYDVEINNKLEAIASKNNIKLHKGVYASVVGPQLETRSEYRMIKLLGADAVGMSTVPEIIVANQLKVKAIAITVLTDECNPDNLKPINIPEIMEMAGKAEPNMITLFNELIKEL